MSASDNAKLQANFKWERDGSMINLYASNAKEFEELLTTLQDTAPLFFSVEQTIKGLARLNGMTEPAAVAAPAASAPQQYAPSAPAQAPTCAHGPMTFIKGVNARGPWTGYKCPAPAGATKCKTIFG